MVEGLSPVVAGIEVRAVEGGVGKITLTTSGSTSAAVLGAAGQPILRIGRGGVEANAAAPEWYADNEPLGIATVPRSAGEQARPRWVRVSVERTWEWFDHRLHPAGERVGRWSIPLLVDGSRSVVRGRLAKASTQLGLRLDGADLAAGVRVSTLDRPVPALRLRNDGGASVRVLGPDGELFARIGPRGAEVNTRSPVWIATAQLRNRDLLSSVIDPAARPQLVLVSPEPELIWPDPRLRPRAAVSPAAGGAGRSAVASWSIPVVPAGARARPLSIEGTTVVVASGADDTGTQAQRETPPASPRGLPAGTAADDDGLLGIGLVVVIACVLLCGGALVARARRA